MKKYALFVMIAALVPNYVFGAHSAKYNSLVAEKQRKMEQLEKCSGSVTGWKIAGISTIGLTAVGVAGNIVLANKKSDMDDKIDSTDSQINRVNTQIAQKEQQIAEQKAAEEQRKKADCENQGNKIYENGICIDKKPEPTKVEPVQQTEKKSCKYIGVEVQDGFVAAPECVAVQNLAKGDFTGAKGCDCMCDDGNLKCKINSCDTQNGYELQGEKCVKSAKKPDNSKTPDNSKKPDNNSKKEEQKQAGCLYKNSFTSVNESINNEPCFQAPANEDRLTGGKFCSCKCVADGEWDCQVTACDEKEYRFESFTMSKPYGHCEKIITSCNTLNGNVYKEGDYTLNCSGVSKTDYPNADMCDCTCKDGVMTCKAKTCKNKSDYDLIDGKCVKKISTAQDAIPEMKSSGSKYNQKSPTQRRAYESGVMGSFVTF